LRLSCKRSLSWLGLLLSYLFERWGNGDGSSCDFLVSSSGILFFRELRGIRLGVLLSVTYLGCLHIFNWVELNRGSIEGRLLDNREFVLDRGVLSSVLGWCLSVTASLVVCIRDGNHLELIIFLFLLGSSSWLLDGLLSFVAVISLHSFDAVVSLLLLAGRLGSWSRSGCGLPVVVESIIGLEVSLLSLLSLGRSLLLLHIFKVSLVLEHSGP
jgi:hypothetical protein